MDALSWHPNAMHSKYSKYCWCLGCWRRLPNAKERLKREEDPCGWPSWELKLLYRGLHPSPQWICDVISTIHNNLWHVVLKWKNTSLPDSISHDIAAVLISGAQDIWQSVARWPVSEHFSSHDEEWHSKASRSFAADWILMGKPKWCCMVLLLLPFKRLIQLLILNTFKSILILLILY